MTTDRGDGRWARRVAGPSGLLVAGMGIFALLGWILKFPAWPSLWSETIPMAPSSALLFAVIGVAVSLRARRSQSDRLDQWAIPVGLLVTVVGLGLAITSSMGIFLQAERLGITIVWTPEEFPVGHMSPLTAILFVAAGGSFLTSLRWPKAGRRLASVSWWLASLILTVGLVLILAYLFGVEQLAIIPRMPPAALTSASFFVLGIGLLALAGSVERGTGKISGGSETSFGFFLMIFGLLAIGVVTVGYLSYRNYEDRYREGIESQLLAVWQLKEDEIEDWRAERLGDAQVLYGNNAFSALVEQVLEAPDDNGSRRQLTAWLAKYPEAFKYDRVILLDARGEERLSVPETGEPLASHVIQDAAAAMRSGGIAFLDFHREDSSGRVYLALLVPILPAQGVNRPVGTLILRINPETYFYPFLREWPTPSETAETLLVRREGDEVVFLNELRFRRGTALNLRLPVALADLPAAAAARGETGFMDGTDYRGVPVIAYIGSVPETPWALVARIDREEVTAPMRARLWGTVGVVVAMLFGALAGIGLVWRQQRLRHYESRFEAERERAWLQDVIARSLNEIYVFDPVSLKFVFANTGACQNIGYSMEELTRLTPLDIKPAYTPEEFQAMLRPLRSDERGLLVFETEHRRKDGSEYPVEVHLQLVRSGARSYFLAIIADITQRRRADEALRYHRDLLREMGRVAKIGGWEFDPVSGKGTWTEQVARIHELEPGDETNMALGLSFYQGESRARIEQAIRDAIELGRPYDVELELTAPSGTHKWVQTIGAPVLVDGRVVNVRGSFQDITERKRAEEELRRHVLYLQALQKTTLELLSLPGLDALFENIVRRAGDLVGTAAGFLDLVEPGSVRMRPQVAVGALADSLDNPATAGVGVAGVVWQTAAPLIVEDYDSWPDRLPGMGKGKVSSVVGVPLLRGSEVLGVIGLGHERGSGKAFTPADVDVLTQFARLAALAIERAELLAAVQAERNSLAEHVRERTAELERANRELEAFAYSVSHDLRAPLRAMEGFSTALLSHHLDQMDEKGRHYLERIQQASQRMGQLINDMLNLSRITRADLNAQPVDLSLLAHEVAAELRTQDPERKVEFVIADRLTVQGDEQLLRIALENLLDNALKFTGTRPKAVIEVGRLSPAEFESQEGDWAAHVGLPERPHPSTAIYYVRDNGVGFDMAYAERLFAPFQRLHAMHEFPGTGIGLAIVQRVVARHNGLVWAHARLGHGATFCFTLGGAL